MCFCARSFFTARLANVGILTVAAHLSLKVLDLRERRVLATRSEEITQVAECDTAVAALVEEGEGLLEVCALRLLVHGWLAGLWDVLIFVVVCFACARVC
jgi:hypothetical protein